jgi:hypothetical protein
MLYLPKDVDLLPSPADLFGRILAFDFVQVDQFAHKLFLGSCLHSKVHGSLGPLAQASFSQNVLVLEQLQIDLVSRNALHSG